jgi:uncharacterized protein (TIGR00369 family)
MELLDWIAQPIDQRDISAAIDLIPYAGLIGMECMMLGEEVIYRLPALESNIGNPTLPAIHGGVMGGFMENAAILFVLKKINTDRLPKVVDLSIDYLRPGRFQDTYARCEVVRQGRKIANVSVTVWQDHRSKPIANARTHLLL